MQSLDEFGPVEKRFLIFANVVLLSSYFLPLEEGVAVHLNKIESPSPKDALCHV